MSGAADIYDRAAVLLEGPGAWTQGAFARNEWGRSVLTQSDDAVCFCGAGAVYRVTGYSHTASGLIDKLTRRGVTMAAYNDAPGRTQAQVVKRLREAAKRARKQALPLRSREGS